MHGITTRHNSKPVLTALGTTEKCIFLPEEEVSELTRRGIKLIFFSQQCRLIVNCLSRAIKSEHNCSLNRCVLFLYACTYITGERVPGMFSSCQKAFGNEQQT